MNLARYAAYALVSFGIVGVLLFLVLIIVSADVLGGQR